MPKKNNLILVVFFAVTVLMLSSKKIFAHMGITPFKVLGNMEKQGTGPFSVSRPNSKDTGRKRLGVKLTKNESFFGIGEDGGLLVERVRDNSPANNGGIRVGDILTEFNGFTMSSIDDLEYAVKQLKKGQRTLVRVSREGEGIKLEILFTGSYESRISVGPSIKRGGMSNKMLEKVKRGEIGPASVMHGMPKPPSIGGKIGPAEVFKKMRSRGTGPFAVIRKKQKQTPTVIDFEKDSPVIPKIQNTSSSKNLDLDSYIGNFSVYLKNKEALFLDKEQVEKIQRLYIEQKKRNTQKKTQLNLVQIELGKVFRDKNVDFNAAKKLLEFASSVEKEWRVEYIVSLKKLYSFLSPKQKELISNP